MTTMQKIRTRISEPSTWAGVATIILAGGQAFTTSGSKVVGILSGLAAAAGGAAAWMAEKKDVAK